MTGRSRGSICPSFARRCPSQMQRAQGKPGAGCTRSLACKRWKHTSFSHYRFNRSDPALPARRCYGLSRAYPGETWLCCLRSRAVPCRARGADIAIAARLGTCRWGAGPARFCRPQCIARPTMHRVHRIPRPTFGDDWPNAPLAEAGWAERTMILRNSEEEYFSQQGWTNAIRLRIYAI